MEGSANAWPPTKEDPCAEQEFDITNHP